MARNFKSGVVAAALAGLFVSACSCQKQPEPVDAVPLIETPPEPKAPPAPSMREVREAFDTVTNSNAAPRPQNPAGNKFYTIDSDMALRAEPETQSSSLKTLHAGSCMQILDAHESRDYAKVDIVGQNAQGWISKRALRPSPGCAQ